MKESVAVQPMAKVAPAVQTTKIVEEERARSLRRSSSISASIALCFHGYLLIAPKWCRRTSHITFREGSRTFVNLVHELAPPSQISWGLTNHAEPLASQ